MATVTLQKIEGIRGELQRAFTGVVTGKLYSVNPLGQVTVSTLDSPYLIARGWLPIVPGAGSGPATSGTTTVNFGAFPGSQFAQKTLAVVDAYDPNAVLFADWVPLATADHSADEHMVDAPIVSAVADGNGNIIISAVPNTNIVPVDSMMPWGAWSVAWAFLP